ncbi:hypothetical protein F5148DRAFT_1221046 [Russula earlei]|uniref:Uncharacterized protein n=1 Tax=Russula earlei TaxID=71964 RepID=A0ACC0U2C8_9AGAM|nr:hypothetical protein F5148DRAFT_1221046 [Russula earlei]
MLLMYTSPDLLSSSITDVGSGVRLFSIHTEYFYTAERVYHPVAGTHDTCVRRHRTFMTDIHQRQVAEILWAGRVPLSMCIHGETLESVTTLFNGCDSITVMPSELRVPTRIGAVWVATRRSLELRCSTSGDLRSAFHLNSVQVGHRLHPATIPGTGSHFLEIHELHPAYMVEMIVSCLVMDILRRNIFDISPHDFDQHLGPCRQSDPTSRSLIARLAGPSRAWRATA